MDRAWFDGNADILGVYPKRQRTQPHADYRGYFNLDIKIGRPSGLVLGGSFRYAEQGASGQFDLTYPLHKLLAGNLDLYLHVEYVNCLAESLLHYTDRTKALRIGFAVVR